MSKSDEVTVLWKWLEQCLKEHFAWKIRRNTILHRGDCFILHSKTYKRNGVPIEATFLDLRILDLQLEKERMCQNCSYVLDDNASEENLKSYLSLENDPYKQGNSHVHLVYQRGSQSVGKELHLCMFAESEEIDLNVESNERFSIPKYVISLDEHQIDVYNQVFPMLQDWALSKGVIVEFCVPECYYGSYYTETGKNETHGIPDVLVFRDDIMSKTAAGLELLEMEKRNAENGNSAKLTNYRLLILEDVEYDGFTRKTALDSSFLSLLNVEEVLKRLAEIHCVSWAFTKLTGEPLESSCPFLHNPLYLTYIGERIRRGFPVMVGIAREYLLEHEMPENEIKRILQWLIELKTRLASILEDSCHPKTAKCLVHQNVCGQRILFRYSLLSSPAKPTVMKAKQTKKDSKIDVNSASASFLPQTSKHDCETKARRDQLEKELKREVMIINWQTASVGSPMLDVAFLLMTSLPPKTRRVETSSLLKIYWNTFRMQAEKFGLSLEWSDKELYEDYLQSLLYSCVLVTGNVDEDSIGKLDDDGIETFLECVKDLMSAGVI